jgi:hypothetical protein
MNPNVRHNCLEVPLSDTEQARIVAHCTAIGLAKSVFARFSMLHLIESNSKADEPPAESLPCRDAPAANRASLGIVSPAQHHRRVALPGRRTFGYRTPKRLL